MIKSICFATCVAVFLAQTVSAFSSDVNQQDGILDENLDKVKTKIYTHLSYSNGDKYYAGDKLYYLEDNGSFSIAELKEFEQQRVKVILDDGVSAWVDIDRLFTKERLDQRAKQIEQDELAAQQKLEQERLFNNSLEGMIIGDWNWHEKGHDFKLEANEPYKFLKNGKIEIGSSLWTTLTCYGDYIVYNQEQQIEIEYTCEALDKALMQEVKTLEKVIRLYKKVSRNELIFVATDKAEYSEADFITLTRK